MISRPIVIFVRPQAVGNIGALSRVMANFYCQELRLVGTPPESRGSTDPFEVMDWALSKCGESVLKSAQWFSSIPEAAHDVHMLVGTSGREVEYDLGYARPLLTPRKAISHVATLCEKEPAMKWALVFGPEDDGLNAQESAFCRQLIRIPTDPQNSSMNIAMSAGCLLYEVNELIADQSSEVSPDLGPFLGQDRASRLRSTEEGRSELASESQKESFLAYFMETLSMTQFLKYPDHESVRARVRRWLQVAPMPLGELLFAFELLYHFRAWGTGKFEPRDFLRRQ